MNNSQQWRQQCSPIIPSVVIKYRVY